MDWIGYGLDMHALKWIRIGYTQYPIHIRSDRSPTSSSASFTESPRRHKTEHRADSEYEITPDSNNIIMRPGRNGVPTVLMRPDIFDRYTITTD
jgi:hypothetical protein